MRRPCDMCCLCVLCVCTPQAGVKLKAKARFFITATSHPAATQHGAGAAAASGQLPPLDDPAVVAAARQGRVGAAGTGAAVTEAADTLVLQWAQSFHHIFCGGVGEVVQFLQLLLHSNPLPGQRKLVGLEGSSEKAT